MASQSVYVDLDLKTNELLNVGNASVGTSAPNLAQVEAMITTGGWTPAAAATAAGLGLTSTGSTIDVAAGQGLEVDETGLWVNLGSGIGLSGGGGIAVNVGDGLFIEVDDTVAVDSTFVQGIVDTTVGEIDFPVDSVVGTAPITAVDDGTGIYTIGINAAALDFPVDSVGVSAPITNTGTASDPVIGLDVAALSTTLDATFATDAELAAGLALKANASTAINAGAGLTGDGTLAAAVTLAVGATDASIAVAADGISVAPGGITGDKLATEAVGNINLGANLYGLIDVQRLTTDPASAQNGYILTYDNTVSQWVGKSPAAVSVPVTDVEGTVNEIVVTDAAGVFTVGLDPSVPAAIAANTTAISTETTNRTNADALIQADLDAVEAGLATEIIDRTAADDALGDRIDAISIVGTGAASVTESAADSNIWTVHVDSLSLSNTYTGAGTDDASIDTDLGARDPAVVAEAGDLYINTTSGDAFIYDGDTWIALATATAGLNSIASGDNSITVTDGGGPAADIAVSAALQSAIATATAINLAQDSSIALLQGSITDLEATDHPAATGANAIAVDAATQAVSLVIDAASGSNVTQSGTGLLVNLSGYALDADLDAAVADLEGADADLAADIAAEAAARSSADIALDGRVTVLETSDAAQDGRLTAIETVNGTQTTDIDALEAKHTSVPFTLDGTQSVDVVGPAGGTVTVRETNGCIITISVCETVAGTYTLDANAAVSGTVTFG